MTLHIPTLQASYSSDEEEEIIRAYNFGSYDQRGEKRKKSLVIHCEEIEETSDDEETEESDPKRRKVDMNSTSIRESYFAKKQWVGGPEVGTEENYFVNKQIEEAINTLLSMHQEKDEQSRYNYGQCLLKIIYDLEQSFETESAVIRRDLEKSYYFLMRKEKPSRFPSPKLVLLAGWKDHKSERELMTVMQYIIGEISDVNGLQRSCYFDPAENLENLGPLGRLLHKNSSTPHTGLHTIETNQTNHISPTRIPRIDNIQALPSDSTFDENRETAYKHFLEKDYELAIKDYDQLIKSFPNKKVTDEDFRNAIRSYSSFYKLSTHKRKVEGQLFGRMETLYNQLIEMFPGKITPKDLKGAAYVSFRARHFQKARELYKKFFDGCEKEDDISSVEDYKNAASACYRGLDRRRKLYTDDTEWLEYACELWSKFSNKSEINKKDHQLITKTFNMTIEAFKKKGNKEKADTYRQLLESLLKRA